MIQNYWIKFWPIIPNNISIHVWNFTSPDRMERESFQISKFQNSNFNRNPYYYVGDDKVNHKDNQWYKIWKVNGTGKLPFPVLTKEIRGEETTNIVRGYRTSYAEIVKKHNYHRRSLPGNREQRYNRSNNTSILLHNIPHEASAKAVWQFFNKGNFIQDIILPRKKDKNNYRNGFASVSNLALTENLIKVFSGRSLWGNMVVLKLAVSKTRPVQSRYGKTTLNQNTVLNDFTNKENIKADKAACNDNIVINGSRKASC